jgi:osmotically-inducible protein OsmY
MRKTARTDRSHTGDGSEPDVDKDELLASIKSSVLERTGNKIRDLRVELNSDGVRLRGRCASYYSKQLAQQAVMSVAAQYGLTNEIVVA